ncbi:MAG: hypothetical protein NW215_12650 [Hyphomicrobiales bacterium]|nr:hypothetical protein [Hyphomicrobiales bacterium]
MRAAALIALLAAAPALAETPEIARQQRELDARREVWEARDIPGGLVGAEAAGTVTSRSSGVNRVALYLQNVNFTFTSGIGFYVRNLAVTLELKTPDGIVDFDRPGSFAIRIHRGEALLRPHHLNALFNRHVLVYRPRALSNMRIRTAPGRMYAEADLHLRGFDIPTSLGGRLALTRDNRLLYQIDEVEAFGIPVEWLLKRLGLGLTDLASLERPGVSLQSFALRIDHRRAFPMPELRGDIARARLGPDGLRLTFADSAGVTFDLPEGRGESFIWAQSGDLKFFGVVALNARILVKPGAPRRLNFNLYDYRRQLSAATGRLDENGVMTITTAD